ncbi:aspartyl protease family protein [Blastococcus sp. PRF04-17]|uniref:aspartyl protease family protein n=1 Tax=Blastococcus sp. PRF04-17 TaxID=2933797 RepID=UPI001FF4DE86|nr:aspartyl protease family protein [Blastococcus sp. PRF04-17]UOY01738.1 aspartyl protease family protein [Blastococcus sp. PRF04-17]
MLPVPLRVEPDAEFDECALLCVDGTVAGAPHSFVLDTGSPSTQLADPDGLVPANLVGQDTAEGLFGRAPVERVALPDLTVPGLTAGPRTVARLRTGGARSRSLLGLDVLGAHGLLLDGPAASLHATAPEDLAPDLPLERGPRGHCYLPVTLPGGRVVRALWDTGADVTVVDRGLVASHQQLFTAPGSARGTDSSGTTVATDVCRMGDYRIAEVPFAGHVVAVADLPEPMAMVLGYPTLCQAIWAMDLPSGRWAVSGDAPPGSRR